MGNSVRISGMALITSSCAFLFIIRARVNIISEPTGILYFCKKASSTLLGKNLFVSTPFGRNFTWLVSILSSLLIISS